MNKEALIKDFENKLSKTNNPLVKEAIEKKLKSLKDNKTILK